MTYDWGKIGEKSVVYDLLRSGGLDQLDPQTPYAELWMGDHDKAPSLCLEGKRICDICCEKLPFLFKVLSVNKPLSIQVHPSKDLAGKFHNMDPTNFPDSNHKPEMAIFIHNSVLLCGFRPYEDIISFLRAFPEFYYVCGSENSKEFIENPSDFGLKKLVQGLLSNSSSIIKENAILLKRSVESSSIDKISDVITALSYIVPFFPYDVGMFFPLFLNIIFGTPGTAIFIPHGVLHAYLSGDLFEAMTVSDNVVRAGMTPKYIDQEKLIQAVVFEHQPPHYIYPQEFGNILEYVPPTPEFKVIRVSMNANEVKSLELCRASIMIVMDGNGTIGGTSLKRGVIILFSKNSNVELISEDSLDCFFCTCGNE